VLADGLLERLRAALGAEHVRIDDEATATYGADGTAYRGVPDAVVWPGSTADVSTLARLCTETRTPIVPRGGGTGYSGGAVPVAGGIVVSLERLNRIVDIDRHNLLAVVEPHVVTGVLQAAVERQGLFYPPDPASLDRSVIGGNVAENAGGPRAFKYGVTRRYVLGVEAVLASGDVVRTGGKTVKNVVGYDVTQLLVGSEGTLAILTRIILRLIRKPETAATLRVQCPDVRTAVGVVSAVIADGLVPATLEFVDRTSLEAAARHLGDPSVAPAGTGASLVIEVDGDRAQVERDAARVDAVCRAAGALTVETATSAADRAALWRVRRELSPALRTIAPHKFNHDVVVPRARVADLVALADRLQRESGLPLACFGHAGDGNVHVNIMAPDDAVSLARAREAEARLLEGVVALEGSISGEHGIGLSKARFLGVELTPETVALMRRIKEAFDPLGILNPGKIFPSPGKGL
jgi:glycolate oxidase